MPKLSVIIPVFNEEKTISQVIKAVEDAPLSCDREIVIVNDGSTDGTAAVLKNCRHIVITQDKNKGKGSALKTGFKAATGDMVIVQDADLEYDPKDYQALISPILEGHADAVYGSRCVTAHPRRVLYFHHYLANRLVTAFSNIFTGLNLSDMETGYKVLNRVSLDKILPKLSSKRFGIEPEITARLAKAEMRIYEVGISYRGRTYDEGKKITWRDGVAALWHIIRFNLFS